ncbi:ModE family transcriptional regulator [Echinicola strongylocentroti]|uniref:ModE family transcriptional regulator n=1 Tax=Echinicola strongylocentroti TaxID=1795355 RepID=A0A2Z4IN80_9BACT|nr:LysR family transcriptional regulator [Echinicola strongylocentroti]AWW32190.1 ModE family transcriptional regulator [Echinicola strongylocentroti]
MKLKVNARFWVETDKGPFLGFGRVELLEKIGKLGSISKAASSMNMSNRQAWHLVDSMNAKTHDPLVITQTGGKGGGGAQLTPAGEKAINMFRKLEKEMSEYIDQATNNLDY